jgi:hypothetical protein
MHRELSQAYDMEGWKQMDAFFGTYKNSIEKLPTDEKRLISHTGEENESIFYESCHVDYSTGSTVLLVNVSYLVLVPVRVS